MVVIQVRKVSRLRNYLLFMLVERNMLRPSCLYQLPVAPFLPGAPVHFYPETAMYEIPVYSGRQQSNLILSYIIISG